jgi:long-chain acyl-CoA synthetase
MKHIPLNNPEASLALSYDGSLIPSLLEKASLKFPHHKAIHFLGFTMTYQQIWNAVQQFSRALYNLGVREGERVVLFLPNCPHFIISYYASLCVGAIVVPTNPLYSKTELEFQINDSGAGTLITLDLLFQQVQKVRSGTQLKRIIAGKVQNYLPVLKKFIYPIIAKKGTDNIDIEEKNGVFIFQKLMKSEFAPFPIPSIKSDDTAILQYTGGTTGVSKGAMLSHRNIVFNNFQMRDWYDEIREGKETFISVLPFFHSYGSAAAMNLPLSVGANLVIFPQFKANEILRAIVKHRATILPGIPSIYSVLNSFKDIKKYDISTINYCISGAAPLPVTVLEEFEKKTGGIILEGYGLSEASPVTHANPIKGIRKTGSIGLPLSDTECKIVDIETGVELPLGQAGELCIKGPQVMMGYWNREDETKQVLHDGWLSTGDVAKVDDEGYYYIVERKKDMIISEGFNVYPREIEEFLLKHPKISDSAVVGMPDKLRGEKVFAYVVLNEGEKITSEEIIKYCRDNLAKYKVPKKVIFKDKIPTNITGKKLRRVLRQEGDLPEAKAPEVNA